MDEMAADLPIARREDSLRTELPAVRRDHPARVARVFSFVFLAMDVSLLGFLRQACSIEISAADIALDHSNLELFNLRFAIDEDVTGVRPQLEFANTIALSRDLEADGQFPTTATSNRLTTLDQTPSSPCT